MNVLIEPDDIEPLDADERLDQAYGAYHIGRDDETRSEVALFFDTRWLPQPDFLGMRLWSIVNQNEGRLIAFAEYTSEECAAASFQDLLRESVRSARSSDYPAEAALSVAVVELTKPTVAAVDTALTPYSAYIGYADVSWPHNLRSIITRQMHYC